MDEFDFLSRMFHRLREAEVFAADAKHKKQSEREDAWVTAAIMIRASIRDFLRMRSTDPSVTEPQ